MKLRRRKIGDETRVELLAPQGWVPVAEAMARLPAIDPHLTDDVIGLLALPGETRRRLAELADDMAPSPTPEGRPVLPFEPRSFRDFMLYEAHAIDAARGFVRRFMPAAARLVGAYEAASRRTFPGLKPHALWHRQPIYYMGNHLTFSTDGDIAMPSYTRALDYELELGFVLARPLQDADAETAERAIGGFVVLDDFSARDVQLAEMRSGFGPQKAKHFASAMSDVVVSADEVLPRWRDLVGRVRLNGAVVAECTTRDARWSLGEVLAHASRGERLQPGELFGTGTLPGGSGIETGRLLSRGDTVTLAIDGIGTLSNRIV
jgi:2-keto-4-pentenoate hydratase/2-oxohepta-3-ene-1,7-dioic acid hydratase in catechol pathway